MSIYILVVFVLIILTVLLAVFLNKRRRSISTKDEVSNGDLNQESNHNLKQIEELYSDGFIRLNDNKMKGEEYNLTYGELTYEGMENIVKYLLKSKKLKLNDSTFIDLGCGNGRTLTYALMCGFKQARGTEIVEERYECAIKKRELLDSSIKDHIEISNLDIFKLPNDYFPPNSVIFISNLLFPIETSEKIINFLSKMVKKKYNSYC